MKISKFNFSGKDGTCLVATMWEPDGEARALLQVTHGMTEHISRYEKLATEMCSRGVILAGFDLRGHGENGYDSEVAYLGECGWEASIEDMHIFFELLDQRFSKIPHYMLGFSLGSFLLREYLNKYSDKISGAIIAGTGYQPCWILSIIQTIVKMEIKKCGYNKTTDMIRQLSFGAYNRKFKPTSTRADWLCSDPTQLAQYLADPLVRPDISAGLFYDLLDSMKKTAERNTYSCWNKQTPVLLISGDKDPVGDFGKGVRKVYLQMLRAGIQNTTIQLIQDARHDIFHEDCSGSSKLVVDIILKWIETNSK